MLAAQFPYQVETRECLVVLDVDLNLLSFKIFAAESTDRAIARARIDAWFRLIHATCFSNFSISTGKTMKCVPCTANCDR